MIDIAYSRTPPKREDFHNQIVNLLDHHGITLRKDDGRDPTITISYPTSSPGSIVVGLRYAKSDGTKSEDLFVFQQGQVIKSHYKGKLEKIFPEYVGSHKLNR